MTATGSSAKIWIGLDDKATPGTFAWADGTPLGAWVNWKSGEPDYSGGKENCVRLTWNGEWSDVRCRINNRFACQVPRDLLTGGK